MQQYKDYDPTGFDGKGCFLEDQQDWWVVPVGRNRDSEALAESNFAAALEILGGESETVEVHRFGHWACGWFEIIIVHPDRLEDAESIEKALSDYPVLDDQDFSRREWEAFEENWDSWGHKEFAEEIHKQYGLEEEAYDMLWEADNDVTRQFWCEHANCPYEGDSIRFEHEINNWDSGTLLKLFWTITTDKPNTKAKLAAWLDKMNEVLDSEYTVPQVLRDAPGQSHLFEELPELELAIVPKQMRLWEKKDETETV